MTERGFNVHAYHDEYWKRFTKLAVSGEMDGVKPNEAITRIMKEARLLGDISIRDGDPFVVMGNDGFEGRWFPTGSFKTLEEALTHAEEKRAEEHMYSDGDEVSTTFHTFTHDGIEIRHQPQRDVSDEASP